MTPSATIEHRHGRGPDPRRSVLRRRTRPVTPAWQGRLAVAMLVAGLAALVGFWLPDALADLRRPVSGLTSLGRLAGLVSAYLMLVQVLLVARVPVLERVFGQDRLVDAHREAGLVSVWLLALHLLLVTAGYGGETGIPPWRQLWSFVDTYPGMLLAAAATGCVALVVLTSIRAARRRLRYESWHLLHLYAYLGVGLALPHELWNGRDLLLSPAMTAFWWSAYLVTTGSVLVWRVGVPVLVNLRHRLRVAEVRVESRDSVSVLVTGRRLDRLGARAGQFFIWRFLSGPGWTRGHPYSLSAAPDGRTLRITVKRFGPDSARLAALAPGTRVLVEGPYGRLHAAVRRRSRVVLLATGIAMAPLRAVLEDLAGRTTVTLLYRARDESDLVHTAEIAELADRYGVRVHHLLGRRRRGRSSILPAAMDADSDLDALLDLVPDLAEHEVFLCGPPRWTAAARRAVTAAGVPAACIHEERFAW